MELLEFNLTSIVMLLQFILLAFFLYKFLYQPFLNMTAKRQYKIKEELEQAERIKVQALKMKDEAQKRLASAHEQADKIIDNAHKAVDAYTREEKEKVLDQAQRMIKTAESEIESMKREASETLKKEAVSLAVLMASKIIERKLDEQSQREFLSKMINEAGKDDYS